MNNLTLRVFWFSMLASNLVIAAIACFLLPEPPLTSIDVGALVPGGEGPAGIIWAFGFVVLFGSSLAPRVLGRPPTQALTPAQIIVRATPPLMLSLALAEACALCGLISAHFMGAHVPERVLLPTLASVVAVVRVFPNEARLRALAGVSSAG